LSTVERPNNAAPNAVQHNTKIQQNNIKAPTTTPITIPAIEPADNELLLLEPILPPLEAMEEEEPNEDSPMEEPEDADGDNNDEELEDDDEGDVEEGDGRRVDEDEV